MIDMTNLPSDKSYSSLMAGLELSTNTVMNASFAPGYVCEICPPYFLYITFLEKKNNYYLLI